MPGWRLQLRKEPSSEPNADAAPLERYLEHCCQWVDDLVEEPLEYEERGLERKDEMMDVVADISAANKFLSWNPQVSLREGLKKVLLKEGICTQG